MNNAYAAVSINNTTYAPALFNNLGELVSVLLPNIYVLAGILLLVLMIGGGLAVIAGGQESDPRKTGQGTTAITSALIGFLIIFCSYWIIQIVEVITGFKIL
jgi:hypothetical protein